MHHEPHLNACEAALERVEVVVDRDRQVRLHSGWHNGVRVCLSQQPCVRRRAACRAIVVQADTDHMARTPRTSLILSPPRTWNAAIGRSAVWYECMKSSTWSWTHGCSLQNCHACAGRSVTSAHASQSTAARVRKSARVCAPVCAGVHDPCRVCALAGHERACMEAHTTSTLGPEFGSGRTCDTPSASSS